MAQPDLIEVGAFSGLTRKQYRQVEEFLEAWKRDVLAAAKRHPVKSYALGVEQANAFLRLVGNLATVHAAQPTLSLDRRKTVEWLNRSSLHELEGALDRYIDKIKSALLYGVEGALNPVSVASYLYRATKDGEVNWRRVARTEMIRANAIGRLDACLEHGFEKVWCPPHVGSCKACKRLLENKVFDIAQVRAASNAGGGEQVPCIPLHPHCRHAWLPYIEDLYQRAQQEYAQMQGLGLTDEVIDSMFDSSGQVKPEFKDDPRLQMFKRADPYAEALGLAIQKTHRHRTVALDDIRASLTQRALDPVKVNAIADAIASGSDIEPVSLSRHEDDTLWVIDGQHRVEAAKRAGRTTIPAYVYDGLDPFDEAAFTQATISKGFFDNPQAGLDPLLWEGQNLRREVRNQVLAFLTAAFGVKWPQFVHPFITGGATSRQWMSVKHPEGDPDVDVQLVVDYPQLRAAEPAYRSLTDPDLHAALVTAVKVALTGREAAPGIRLDAFIRPEQTLGDFKNAVVRSGQGVWDVRAQRWLQAAPAGAEAEDGFLEGEGGQLALAHPGWEQAAEESAQRLDALLAAYEAGEPEALAHLKAAYTTLHDARQSGYATEGERSWGNFLWQYLVNFGPLLRVKRLVHDEGLEKTWPHYSIDVAKGEVGAYAPGEQHWITVHPHGEDQKGIPVLVQEIGGGRARIVGGAGGNLNMVILSHSGRMKGSKTKGRDKQLEQQPLSPEEAEARRAAHEQASEQARAKKTEAQDRYKDLDHQIKAFIAGIVNERGVDSSGAARGWDSLDEKDQAKLLQRAVSTAREQAGAGFMLDGALNKAGKIVLPEPKAPSEKSDLPDTEGADEPEEREDAAEDRAPTVSPLAMSTEESKSLLGMLELRAAARRQVKQANRVISGEVRPADVSTLDWRPDTNISAAQERAWAREAQVGLASALSDLIEGRTPRQWLDPDAPEDRQLDAAQLKKTADAEVERGSLDAFETVAREVLGHDAVPTRMMKLLGVSGTAQALAAVVQEKAKEGSIDLKALKGAIEEMNADRQQRLMDVALNRARNAMTKIVALRDEHEQMKGGNSLYTETQLLSERSRMINEAAKTVAQAAAGVEALNTLWGILEKPISKVEVHGYTSPAQVKDLAERARLRITDRDIERHGAGDYSLSLSPERVTDLLRKPPPAQSDELSETLKKIRTGEDMDRVIADACEPAPGSTWSLDRAQGQGQLYLRTAKKCMFAAAPGVGKTATTLAAFSHLLSENPDHCMLVACPATAVDENGGAWPKDIKGGFGGLDYEVVNQKLIAKLRTMTPEQRKEFGRGKVLVGSIDTLKRSPEWSEYLPHTVTCLDESQYAKSEKSQNFRHMRGYFDGREYGWLLSGTPVEKTMGDLHNQMALIRPEEYHSVEAFKDRYEQLGQYEHMTSAERVRHFREATAHGMFYVPQDTAAMPALTDLKVEHAELTDGHKDLYRQRVADFNKLRRGILDRRKELRDQGLSASEAVKATPKIPGFGGHEMLMDALAKPHKAGYRGPNARAQKVADLIAEHHAEPIAFKGMSPGDGAFDEGQHAGTYARKTIVFNRHDQPLDAIHDELKARGIKVFRTRSGTENGKKLQAFLDHEGPCVLMTTDTNKTARSLQFGANGTDASGRGRFQHGATQVIHTDLPQNNADLQQRVARAWRRGAKVPVSQHIISSGTPTENRAFGRLFEEQKRQTLIGNPEDTVTQRGEQYETMHSKLGRRSRVTRKIFGR